MKYMGSKARIANDILKIILSDRVDGQYYVEPFVGGCNVIDKVDGNRIASDYNKYLISMWKFLTQTKLELPHNISRETYSFWRNIWHKRNCVDITSDDAMIGWVGFMASFNGRFFDGGYSGHSVKIKNGVRDYIQEQISNTIRQVDSLKGVDFRWASFQDLEIPPQSIIYCDPPYKGTKQYHISKDFNYDVFYDWCRRMKDIGHTVFVSEYNMPHDFDLVWEKETKNSMNQTNTKVCVERLYKI